MKRLVTVWVVGCSLAILDGCATHLDVSPERPNYARNDVQTGADYGLPMLQYRLKVSWTLATCMKKERTGDVPAIQFLVKVVPEPHYVTGERYAVDYKSLSNWSKVTSLEIQTYDSGTIKSVNGSAEDQSAAIVGDVVKTGIAVAGLVAGVPATSAPTIGSSSTSPSSSYWASNLVANLLGPPGTLLLKPDLIPAFTPEPKQPQQYACSLETKRILGEIKNESASLMAKAEKLQALSFDAAVLERALLARGLAAQDKVRLVDLQNAIAQQTKSVSDSDEYIAGLVAKVSVSEEITWPTDRKQRQLDGMPNDKDSEKLMELFTQVAVQSMHSRDDIVNSMKLTAKLEPVTATQGANEQLRDAMSLIAAVAATMPEVAQRKLILAKDSIAASSGDAAAASGPPDDGPLPASQRGILYRTPVPAQLLFCQTGDPRSCTAGGASAVIINTGVLAPQLGPLRLLPLENGIFQNNALIAAFRENGGLASFKYEDKAARGKVLSGAAASAVAQYAAFQDTKTTFKQKQADAAAAADATKQKAVIDDLDNQIAILQKSQTLATLQLSNTASLADALGETARLNAKIALLEARLKAMQLQDAIANAKQ